jgi:hypothetical protein
VCGDGFEDLRLSVCGSWSAELRCLFAVFSSPAGGFVAANAAGIGLLPCA